MAMGYFMDAPCCLELVGKEHQGAAGPVPIGPWSHAANLQERIDNDGNPHAASVFMKTTKSTGASRKPSESIQQARNRLTAAERSLEAASRESRTAKKKRKAAKEAARRAKKRLRRAKDELAEARRALADAEEKQVSETQRLRVLARVRRAARRPTRKPPKSRRVKKAKDQPTEESASETVGSSEPQDSPPLALAEIAPAPVTPETPPQEQSASEPTPST
jgi:hypothetical protein